MIEKSYQSIAGWMPWFFVNIKAFSATATSKPKLNNFSVYSIKNIPAQLVWGSRSNYGVVQCTAQFIPVVQYNHIKYNTTVTVMEPTHFFHV